jgi:CRISPR-associated protein Cmr4
MPAELGEDSIGSVLFGKEARIVVLTDRQFAELAEELPTVARNYLENGVSANLWYEEFVPRESRFIVPIAHPANDTALTEGLALPEINHHVQIGANATVGNGFTEWNAI